MHESHTPVPPPLPPGEDPPDIPAPSPGRLSLRPPLLLVIAAVLLLGLIAVAETFWLARQPWVQAVLAPDYQMQGPEVIGLRVRHLPPEYAPLNRIAGIEGMVSEEERAELEAVIRPEAVVAIEMEAEALAPLLRSGRLPEAGRPEVLAGPLVRFEHFELDGVRFEVVGELHQGVSGLLYSYLLPLAPGVEAHFHEEHGATRGSLHPEGQQHLEELVPELTDEDAEAPTLLTGQIRTPAVFSAGVLLGLILAATGGAWGYVRMYRRWQPGAPWLFRDLMGECVRLRGLLIVMHVGFYGLFFLCMAAGLRFPLLNYYVMTYISRAFMEGQLAYVGTAYADGDILMATLATFHNNYIIQTLGLTFGISLVPLALGALKTAASFALVGFAMAPVWAGTAAGMTYHSITMILELQAYILASFAVVVWPLRVYRAFRHGPADVELLTGGRILLGAAALTAIMLFIAAAFEAVTLILIHPAF